MDTITNRDHDTPIEEPLVQKANLNGHTAQQQERCPKVRVEVHHADAYDFIGTLPPESVDLILTSPPYWGQRGYTLQHNWDILNEWKKEDHEPAALPSYEWYRVHGGVLGLEPLPEWYILHLVEVFERAKRCLKPKGNLWINLGDTYFARWASIRDGGRQGLGNNERQRRKTPMGGYRQEKQLLLIPARFAIAMQDKRWILRNDLIWHKPNIPPRPEEDRLRLAHEHFFHFVKRPKEGRAKYYYDLKHVEPSETDVVTCNVRPGQNGHTATFPVKLIKPRILSSCPEGGTVFDPFCGTGRTLSVAYRNGRHSIGCDAVEDYANSAREYVLTQEIEDE
ncbi:MAG: site-specific DNA-methyltransferase [Kouleothrix sp.]|nr:site-specific DNA-methyltransferase [Kouleothrix sp.]